MPYTTAQRMFLLSTPLGEDVLLIKDFGCRERLSRLFEIRLTVLSERDDIAADEIVGKRVTLRIETALDERHWTGMVSSFERVGTHLDPGASEGSLTAYTMEIVPWLWFLLLHEDSRIFQNQSVPEIVETILGEFQFTDYDVQKLTGNYPPLVYVTQYRETTFAFISRLLERAGIYYYVQYEAEAEKLVFIDNKDGHPALDDDEIRFAEQRLSETEDTIDTLSRRQHMRTGRVVMRDYNFERPGDTLEASVDSLVRIGDNSNYERFEYPGGYATKDEGDRLARVLMEAEEAEHEILDGRSNVRTFVPGYRFSLQDHPDSALNREYLIVGVQHYGSNNLGGEDEGTYGNSFSCIPASVLYREPMLTPRARMPGLHNAIVVGPPGEEIYTDKYGRVKVHFFWDRQSQRNDKSSCWVRVMQPVAGNGWGMFSLPRIGQEVIVDFIEGDPDHPVIIGSLYNANNMPPYGLPAEATKSTIKSNSSKGGDGFNELRFEDKAGSEEVFLHAQKDLQVRAQNDYATSVGANQSLTVGGNRTEHVAKEQHLIVDERNVVEIAKESHLDIGQNATLAAGNLLNASAGTLLRLYAGTGMHLKSGVTLVLEGGVKISLKAGASSITLGPAGVTIDGPFVKINSGGSGDSAEKADKPDKPKKAGEAIAAKTGKVSDPGQQVQAAAMRNAAAQAQPFCAVCEAARAALQAMGAAAGAVAGAVSGAGAQSKADGVSHGGSESKGGSVSQGGSDSKATSVSQGGAGSKVADSGNTGKGGMIH